MKDTASFFRIAGIGVFTQQESLKLAGFAPAPPDDELAAPEDFGRTRLNSVRQHELGNQPS
ncbi:hypothetical protein AB0C38_28975 [Amycolatopsis sp. NPDC048633]|uniref:hypothetical protein n=1 Tax=Amycolatopsis sp. NPDC048633 TaxID=3157095 RepID=UPI0033FEB4A6